MAVSTQRQGPFSVTNRATYSATEDPSTGVDFPSDGNMDFYLNAVKTMAMASGATSTYFDIVGAALTTGKALDISDLDAITTGKAIHVDATGITHTTGILVHLDSASTAMTGAGRVLLVDHTADFNDSAGIVMEVKSVHTTGTGLQLTMNSVTDGFAMDVAVNALTSGTGIDMGAMDAITTGKGINVQDTSEAFTSGILLDVGHTGATSNADMTGNVAKFASSITDTDTTGTAVENYDCVLISRTDVMNGSGGTLNADGALLKLESTATQTAGTLTQDVFAIESVTNSFSASATYAMKITHDNASSGAAAGIDMAAFAAGEAIINFPAGNASSIDPSATAETGWLNISVDGTIRYVPFYAAS